MARYGIAWLLPAYNECEASRAGALIDEGRGRPRCRGSSLIYRCADQRMTCQSVMMNCAPIAVTVSVPSPKALTPKVDI